MAYRVELPPFSKPIERKEDFQNTARGLSAIESLSSPNVTGPEPESPVTPVTTGNKNTAGPAPRFDLVVRSGPAPVGPIVLNAWTTVTAPEKFIEHTLSELSAYAAGRASWVRELVDEKIDALKTCGVEAQLRRIQ